MAAFAREGRVVSVLWSRDLLLFFRQRSRIVGTLAQPLLFWLALGSGMAPTFRLADQGVGYMEYFFPGTVLMLILFSSIALTMSVIEDRHQGFLQGVLVAPGSRGALVVGKTLGASTVCLLQSALFLLLAPLAGFPFGSVSWGLLILMAALTSIALTSIGFIIAWWLDSSQAYHLVMSLLLLPLWVLSGALFPASGLHPAMRALVRWNPLSYAVSGLRRGLTGGVLPNGTELAGSSAGLEVAVVASLAAVSLAAASWVCSRRPA